MYSITEKGLDYLATLRDRIEGEFGLGSQTRVEDRRDLAVLRVLELESREDEWEQTRVPEEYQIRLRGLVRQGYIDYDE